MSNDTCRRCGEPLLWAARADTGTNVALDRRPSQAGFLRLARSHGRRVAERVSAADVGVPVYVPHSLVCDPAGAR